MSGTAARWYLALLPLLMVSSQKASRSCDRMLLSAQVVYKIRHNWPRMKSQVQKFPCGCLTPVLKWGSFQKTTSMVLAQIRRKWASMVHWWCGRDFRFHVLNPCPGTSDRWAAQLASSGKPCSSIYSNLLVFRRPEEGREFLCYSQYCQILSGSFWLLFVKAALASFAEEWIKDEEGASVTCTEWDYSLRNQ